MKKIVIVVLSVITLVLLGLVLASSNETSTKEVSNKWDTYNDNSTSNDNPGWNTVIDTSTNRTIAKKANGLFQKKSRIVAKKKESTFQAGDTIKPYELFECTFLQGGEQLLYKIEGDCYSKNIYHEKGALCFINSGKILLTGYSSCDTDLSATVEITVVPSDKPASSITAKKDSITLALDSYVDWNVNNYFNVYPTGAKVNLSLSLNGEYLGTDINTYDKVGKYKLLCYSVDDSNITSSIEINVSEKTLNRIRLKTSNSLIVDVNSVYDLNDGRFVETDPPNANYKLMLYYFDEDKPFDNALWEQEAKLKFTREAKAQVKFYDENNPSVSVTIDFQTRNYNVYSSLPNYTTVTNAANRNANSTVNNYANNLINDADFITIWAGGIHKVGGTVVIRINCSKYDRHTISIRGAGVNYNTNCYTSASINVVPTSSGMLCVDVRGPNGWKSYSVIISR